MQPPPLSDNPMLKHPSISPLPPIADYSKIKEPPLDLMTKPSSQSQQQFSSTSSQTHLNDPNTQQQLHQQQQHHQQQLQHQLLKDTNNGSLPLPPPANAQNKFMSNNYFCKYVKFIFNSTVHVLSK